MKIKGILETALYVADLERAAQFYKTLFDFSRLLCDERMIALNVCDEPRAVLLLFLRGASSHGADVPGGKIPPHDGSGEVHFAFSIDDKDLDLWRAHLKNCGVEIISEVHPPQGGHSLYFRDADGHLAELATPRIWDI